jgi:protein-tyrosine phosphatase
MSETTRDNVRGEAFRLLFVCTGNTCRSPLAEALARRELARRGWDHVTVRSAGVAAFPGVGASDGALRVGGEAGLSLEAHRSRLLSEEEVAWADLILTMSWSHLEAVADRGGAEKVALLTAFAAGDEDDPDGIGGVSDPIGGDDELYRATLRELEGLVGQVLRRLEPILAP